MQWIDILLIAALVLLTALAVYSARKHRGSCCGNCDECRKKCDQNKKE